MPRQESPPEVERLLAHADWLRALARHLVGDADVAKDVVQDTWAAAVRVPPASHRPARPWLAEVLRNFARQWGRGARNRRRREDEAASRREGVPTPGELLERAETQRLLVDLVTGLPEPFRATLLLRYYEGLSAAAIARELGVPAGTIRWRLSEAISRLRAGLDDRHRGGRRSWSLALAPLLGRGRGVPLWKGALIMATKSKALIVVAVIGLVAVVGTVGWRMQARHAQVGKPGAAEASRSPARPARLDPAIAAAWGRARAGAAGTIEGVVRDPDGRVVEGALVAVTAEVVEERLRDPDAARPASTVVTGAGGQYRAGPIPPGLYTLTATSPDWAPADRLGVALVPGESVRDVELVLARGGVRLAGRVLDAGGGAIAGATVRARALGAAARPHGVRTYVVRSAADGRYQLTVARGNHALIAEADAYAPLVETLTLEADKSHDLRLAPASRLSGRVVDRGGTAVAGATVRLEEERVLAARTRDALSDAEGAFVFANVEPGAYQVRARLGALVGRHAAKVAVAPTTSVGDIVVEVAAGLTAAGRVRTGSGAPIAGARVRARDGSAEATSQADGAFRLEGLLPGPLRLLVEAPRFGPAETTVLLARDRDDIDVVLPAAGRVKGVVRARDGQPLPGAQVAALVAPPGPREVITSTAVARTDEGGRFLLEGLGPGELRVEATHPDQGHGLVGPFAFAEGEEREVDLRIGAGGFVRGTVRWEDRRPAVGVEVTGGLRGKAATHVFTDDQGRYEIGPFVAGAVGLRAVPDPDPLSSDGAGASAASVTLAADEVKEGVDLVLPKFEAQIDGVVLDPEGKPLAGATVGVAADYKGVSYRPYNRYAIDLGEIGTFTVLSGDDGAFAIKGLPKTALNVWAAHPAYPEAVSYNVPSGSSGVRLRFVAGATLAGRAVSAAGKPVVDYELAFALSSENDAGKEIRAARGYVQRSLTVHDFAGAFEADRLHPAVYDLIATTPDGRGGRLSGIPVAAGQRRQDLKITVGPSAAVRGRVVDGTGAPVAGARVSTWVTMMVKEAAATTGADGGFRLTGLVPGAPATILVRADRRFAPRTQVVPVAAGQDEVDAGVVTLEAARAR